MNWLEFTVSVLAGLAAAIPLVVKLIEYVKKAVREKNWNALLELVMDYMAIAENSFATGVERKEWVLAMVAESADTVNYDIDLAVVGRMIDQLCDMSKVINSPTAKE